MRQVLVSCTRVRRVMRGLNRRLSWCKPGEWLKFEMVEEDLRRFQKLDNRFSLVTEWWRRLQNNQCNPCEVLRKVFR